MLHVDQRAHLEGGMEEESQTLKYDVIEEEAKE